MSREGIAPAGHNEPKRLQESVRVAAFEKAANMLEDYFELTERDVNIEAAKDILYAFLEEQVENATRFESREKGVSLVYSSVDVSTIAKKLYREYSGREPVITAPSDEKTKKEFLFESFISPRNAGALFTFFEQALHHVITELPHALEDLKMGKEPKKHEVYFMGHPTRDLGHLTPGFVAELKDNRAFEKYGELYGELVTNILGKESTVPDTVFLRGISLGAPQAIETAKHLLEAHIVTQSHDEAAEGNIPYLQVRIDTPPSQDDSTPARRGWQIPAGFVIHGIEALATDPYVRATSNPASGFMKELFPLLAEKGIEEDMSPEQVRLKKEAIGLVHKNLYAGVAIPDELKVTEVVGLHDLTMFSRSFNKDVRAHQEEHPGSLGGNMATQMSENRHTFGLAMGHNIPNFVPNELERLARAAAAVERLKPV